MTATRGGIRSRWPDALSRLPPPGELTNGAWDEFAVVVGSTVWDGRHLADQEIAQNLSEHLPVLYVDPPVSHLTARRVAAVAASLDGPRLRLLTPTLARTTPVVLPGKSRPVLHHVTGALLRRHVRRTTGRMGGRVRMVVTMTPMHRVLGVCHESFSVHWVKDDYGAGADLLGIPQRRVRRRESAALDRADLVVAASAAIAERLRARGVESKLIPNGVNATHYATETSQPADVGLPGPVAGFVGTISARIDLTLLEALAEQGRSLLLVGARQHTFHDERFERLVARPNVRWVGPILYEELPSYLAAMDVGLLPYADTSFNRASFPLKILEYLAAGIGVVATDLPAVRWLDTDLVRVAMSPESFRAAVDDVAQDRAPGEVERRRAFARRHSWAERVAGLVRETGVTGAAHGGGGDDRPYAPVSE